MYVDTYQYNFSNPSLSSVQLCEWSLSICVHTHLLDRSKYPSPGFQIGAVIHTVPYYVRTYVVSIKIYRTHKKNTSIVTGMNSPVDGTGKITYLIFSNNGICVLMLRITLLLLFFFLLSFAIF